MVRVKVPCLNPNKPLNKFRGALVKQWRVDLFTTWFTSFLRPVLSFAWLTLRTIIIMGVALLVCAKSMQVCQKWLLGVRCILPLWQTMHPVGLNEQISAIGIPLTFLGNNCDSDFFTFRKSILLHWQQCMAWVWRDNFLQILILLWHFGPKLRWYYNCQAFAY